ncbi:hypothetical protein [Tindallia californiensis]|uniref:Uncharacterized protein n=1 Tax=Tindallia californiensis TaxID=159292 RepID=A0A1H3MD11_9FIRM|nr:hypothetical protein [Tindallia californiensis]SDY73905.1 hypothetical protein SAMN05192546_10466 [Tindallia californiensis]
MYNYRCRDRWNGKRYYQRTVKKIGKDSDRQGVYNAGMDRRILSMMVIR